MSSSKHPPSKRRMLDHSTSWDAAPDGNPTQTRPLCRATARTPCWTAPSRCPTATHKRTVNNERNSDDQTNAACSMPTQLKPAFPGSHNCGALKSHVQAFSTTIVVCGFASGPKQSTNDFSSLNGLANLTGCLFKCPPHHARYEVVLPQPPILSRELAPTPPMITLNPVMSLNLPSATDRLAP